MRMLAPSRRPTKVLSLQLEPQFVMPRWVVSLEAPQAVARYHLLRRHVLRVR